jgi:hypothetical protein
MLTFIPTQLLASTASQPAFADVRLESGPPTSTGQFSSTIRGSVEWQTVQNMSAHPAFLARSTVQTSRKVHSLPIHPPR